MTLVTSDSWTTAAPYVAALVAASAVLAVAWISHSGKISEFRQSWINDLRVDLADYVGAAEKWFQIWDELNGVPQDEREARIREELLPLSNQARVILWRIRLRFNPRQNAHSAEDNALLENLLGLMDPSKIDPINPDAAWLRLADATVEQARNILKREWEVTKRFPVFGR